jgi:hypothetical protein
MLFLRRLVPRTQLCTQLCKQMTSSSLPHNVISLMGFPCRYSHGGFILMGGRLSMFLLWILPFV